MEFNKSVWVMFPPKKSLTKMFASVHRFTDMSGEDGVFIYVQVQFNFCFALNIF